MKQRRSLKSRRHSLTWLFDLDNTLHDASHAIFPAINANMNAYMARVLGQDGQLASDELVNTKRLEYWKRYGATLMGMVQHHNVKAEEFLHHAHRFDDLPSMIRGERGLSRTLDRLPGRKILLTNAPRLYSRDVLHHLGLKQHFASHLPIEAMTVHRRLRPKPSRALLRKLMRREKLTPSRTVLVEDTPVNLRSARQLGLKTVFITRYVASRPHPLQATPWMKDAAARRRPAYVDVKVKSLASLPRQLRRLLSVQR